MQLLLDMQQIYGANDSLGFWLISLAESLYKIVLKVMINCLKKMMVIIIDSFQVLFFMVGRSWLKVVSDFRGFSLAFHVCVVQICGSNPPTYNREN